MTPLPQTRLVPVAAAVVRSSGMILLSSRPAAAEGSGYWEFPGGKIHDGETPASCAERELKEELDADIIALDTIFRADYEYPGKKVRLFFVRAFLKMNSQLRPLDGQEFKWVPLREITRYRLLPADLDFVQNFIAG